MHRIAYLRVSTNKQEDSGAGLAAQRTAIEAEALRRGWPADSLLFVQDVLSGKSAKRPGLEHARAMLAAGEASTLIVSKMDRLSRSLLDYAGIANEAQRQGWALVALDCPVDMATASGEAMAGIPSVFSQLERRLISDRTRAALAEKRAAGVRLGRPRSLPEDVRDRIRDERLAGETLQMIADRLNVEEVPTAQGGTWHSATVRKITLSC